MATVTQNKSKNTPVFSKRSGPLEVACWQNTGKEDAIYYTLSLKKSWKDESDKWQKRSMHIHQRQVLGAAALLRWADRAVQRAMSTNPKAEDGKPVASQKRYGDRLDVSVWKNITENGDSYSVQLTRSYKQDGQWKDERMSFFGNECLCAAHVLTRGFDGIDEYKAQGSSAFVESAKEQFQAEVVQPDDEDIPF